MEEEKVAKKIIDDPHVIHTYTSDMADVVRENEMSVIKIALAEQTKRNSEELYRAAEGTNIKKLGFIVGGMLLVLCGGFFIYYTSTKKADNASPLSVQQRIQTSIAYENSFSMTVTDTTTEQDVIDAVQTQLKDRQAQGSVAALFLVKTIGTTQVPLSRDELFTLIKTTAPESLVRSLTDNYMLGIYYPTDVKIKPSLFILFQTKDYNQSFAGLLAWEKTMLTDLYPLFTIDISGDKKALLDRPFRDIIIDNTDARILYDPLGTDILYYSFINKDNFIITQSSAVIKEVIRRAITAQAKPI